MDGLPPVEGRRPHPGGMARTLDQSDSHRRDTERPAVGAPGGVGRAQHGGGQAEPGRGRKNERSELLWSQARPMAGRAGDHRCGGPEPAAD